MGTSDFKSGAFDQLCHLSNKIYRIFPSGEVQYLHPKDGVFPEKSNEGRVQANNRQFSIGKNPNPVAVKFSGKGTFES